MRAKTVRGGKCRVCGRIYQLKADGTVRAHWARGADGSAAPGLKDCAGTGKPPADPATEK
ncbi:hypothetical protein [Streptomyces alboviridis]|uniref:hypothetical protein n=1 Tax=Streptomyces alboviridis TaxID=67269 RepID=UPI00131A5784|nr:hypothetical protein [Streptomyces alboviridis]